MMFTFTPTTSSPSPGQYQLARGEKRDTITVGCPKCEGEHQLPKFMMVGADGVTNPEVRCPLFGCGWKSPAMLAEWKAR